MFEIGISIATFIASVLCWLVAGVFLAFSDFVMRSLGAIPKEHGVRAMQAINVAVYRSFFLISLLLVSVLSIGLVTAATLNAGAQVGSAWFFSGGSIYLVTVLLCSVAGNIPMNDKLDLLDAASEATHNYWSTYLSRWTALNHVRTFGSAAAAFCFSCALLMRL